VQGAGVSAVSRRFHGGAEPATRCPTSTSAAPGSFDGIDVGISEGIDALVDAESTKGEVRSSLPALDNPGGSGSQVRVYARTRRDDIVIHPAIG
jgi:hypothetical protein